MDKYLSISKLNNNTHISITGSKSESNRLLLLQALYPQITINNLSNSDDSKIMQEALKEHTDIIDVHHAGTTMRFLTAYLATQQQKEVIITGSQRMKERPIQILVDALNSIGCQISYLEKNGMPPLKIKGRLITKNKVKLKANVSSQYISALMLIAPKLTKGLLIELEGYITSIPYIKMTLALLKTIGVNGYFEKNIIRIEPQKEISPIHITIESDWSSASYYYSFISLVDKNQKISLSSYKKDSLQGDYCLADIYAKMGVVTHFEDNKIILEKKNIPQTKQLSLDLSKSPDIAQTIVVSCLGLGKRCHLTGLHTLKIKETDRLQALQNEIMKLGGEITITENSLTLIPPSRNKIIPNVNIATYNDHRMAMAFAPLCLKEPINILNAEVVSKSYPQFWGDLDVLLEN